jgi:hypothetical protein
MNMIDNNNGTVTDPQTRLMWEQGLCPTRYTWEDAMTVRIAALNGAALGGYTDWRLPTVQELVSLVDYARYSPAIDPVSECQSYGYWSATTYQVYPSYAWIVNFNVGYVYADDKSINYYVRGVRGGS